MKKHLSKKEMAFVLSRLEGNTMEAAFAEGYPSSRKWERASREREANEVMKRPHVRAFYDAEREKIDRAAAEEAKKKAIWSREKSMKILSYIAISGWEEIKEARERRKIDQKAPQVNSATTNMVIKAIAELNKMTDGEYNEDEKSLARQLTDLNPDMIDEDPMDYAVSVKRNKTDET